MQKVLWCSSMLFTSKVSKIKYCFLIKKNYTKIKYEDFELFLTRIFLNCLGEWDEKFKQEKKRDFHVRNQ